LPGLAWYARQLTVVADLDAASARDWVSEHLGFVPVSVTPLSGGVSSIVLLAEGDQRVVVKQSLPQLKVEAEWLCDRRRAIREAAALRILEPVFPGGAVPRLLAEDPARFTFAMSAAPLEAETWKSRLLRGQCDREAARSAGEILRMLVRETAGRYQQEFGDIGIFDDLRLDAYYRYTAARHPDLKPYFDSLIADCVESRHSLVHGDYSPKNILTDGGGAMAIDWECVHYGNPAFDAAFLLNHLLLKTFYLPARRAEFALLANEFWTAVEGAGWFAESTFRHWPGLLLARMDGKSPVEYLRDEGVKHRIREFARDLIARPPTSVDEVFARRQLYNE
jgi:5-methylthioribose kinase